jgi:hypothetical protein
MVTTIPAAGISNARQVRHRYLTKPTSPKDHRETNGAADAFETIANRAQPDQPGGDARQHTPSREVPESPSSK